jgi:hypothetical protein
VLHRFLSDLELPVATQLKQLCVTGTFMVAGGAKNLYGDHQNRSNMVNTYSGATLILESAQSQELRASIHGQQEIQATTKAIVTSCRSIQVASPGSHNVPRHQCGILGRLDSGSSNEWRHKHLYLWALCRSPQSAKG